LWVRAENIPPLRTAPDEFVALVRLFAPQEPRQPGPWSFRTCDELAASGVGGRVVYVDAMVIGRLPIGDDRMISEVLLVDDTPRNRESSWVIVNFDALPYSGQAIRCGAMGVAP
jgi:hypothetical protein